MLSSQYSALSFPLRHTDVHRDIHYSTVKHTDMHSTVHRTALLLIWPLTPAVSSDRLIPAWQGYKIRKTKAPLTCEVLSKLSVDVKPVLNSSCLKLNFCNNFKMSHILWLNSVLNIKTVENCDCKNCKAFHHRVISKDLWMLEDPQIISLNLRLKGVNMFSRYKSRGCKCSRREAQAYFLAFQRGGLGREGQAFLP